MIMMTMMMMMMTRRRLMVMMMMKCVGRIARASRVNHLGGERHYC